MLRDRSLPAGGPLTHRGRTLVVATIRLATTAHVSWVTEEAPAAVRAILVAAAIPVIRVDSVLRVVRPDAPPERVESAPVLRI